jgi:hypothetical protein
VNVPEHVENAAREGIVLIVSKDVFTGRTIRWRSKLCDDGYFLLTQENGLRYRMPILLDPTNPENNRAQMIHEDLVPYLTFMRAKVDIEIARGQEWRAAFFATRLVSVLNENLDLMAGWLDPEKFEAAKTVILYREDLEAKKAIDDAYAGATV